MSLRLVAPVLYLLVLCTSTIALDAVAAPKARLWDRWLAHDPASSAPIEHGAWDAFLVRHVRPDSDGVNRFAYAHVDEDDRRSLDAYIESLADTTIGQHNRRQQLAYWINLYNALTVQVVLDHYPVNSIRDIRISPRLFASGPWGRKLVRVEGEALSLDDIEHRILRPIWRDPRIHYAVNCASIGCPNLQAQAFTADNADALLEQGAREYINHPRGVAFDGDKLVLSSIYVWFEEDFGGSADGVIQHLMQFAGTDLAHRLQRVRGSFNHRYDWRLNDIQAGADAGRYRLMLAAGSVASAAR